MVDICLQNMSTYLVQAHPKCFWEEMTRLLYCETGRDYSWQSCKRRMMRILDSFRMFSALVPDFPVDDPPPVPLPYLEYLNLDNFISESVYDFMAGILYIIPPSRPKEEYSKQEEKEHELVDQKDERIEAWLKRIPTPHEMQTIKAEKGEMQARVRGYLPKLSAEPEQKFQPPPSKRSRSRSPCRAERKHRPRSRSPLVRQQETPVTASGALHGVKQEENERKSRLLLPLYEEPREPSSENPDLDNSQLMDGLDDVAMRFCEAHMHPLIRKLTSNNPVLQNESLDLADSACRAMLKSVVPAATKHITDNFDLKPRRT